MEEQNAKRDLSEKIKELNRLQALVAELKAMPPKVVYNDRRVEVTQEVPFRIGDRVERLMDMYKANNDRIAQRLGLDMLYYYKLCRQLHKQLGQQRKN